MFLENVLVAGKQVLILYILVAVGFICDKAGIYKDTTAKLTNNLLFYIITPAVIIQSFLSVDGTAENIKLLGISALMGAALQIVGILVCMPFFRDKSRDDRCIYQFGAMYGNVGYMALPLADAIFGHEGVFYCSAVVIVFNIFSFTHGIYLMTSSKTKFSPKTLLVNPGTIAVLIGLPLMISGINLPEILSIPVGYVASLNTPMAMIMFGTYLAHTHFKEMFKERRLLLVALIKLMITPLIMLLIFKVFSIGGVMASALLISSSAPSANNTVMFSAKYEKDVQKASNLVAFVSLLSIITMPVMIALGKQIC